jgi:hypothetical protein
MREPDPPLSFNTTGRWRCTLEECAEWGVNASANRGNSKEFSVGQPFQVDGDNEPKTTKISPVKPETYLFFV